MSPQERLLNQEELIELMMVHKYVPQSKNANLMEVIGALREIDSSARYDTSCSGCFEEIARMAHVHLQAYKKSLPSQQGTFHTFPKQERKKPGPRPKQ